MTEMSNSDNKEMTTLDRVCNELGVSQISFPTMELKVISDIFDKVRAKAIEEKEAEHLSTLRTIDKIKKEIDELDKGDASENAPLQVARENLSRTINIAGTLLQQIEALKSNKRIYTPSGVITLGTTIELKVLAVNGEVPSLPKNTFFFKLVDVGEGTPRSGLLAVETVSGNALLGRRAGDEVTVTTLLGNIKFKIERIY